MNLSIKKSYSIIFIILVFWSSIAYYTMNTLISSQSYYAKLINLSGKQRMLSQKSAFLVSKYIQKNQVNYIDELKKAINTFEKNHHYIVENLSSNAKKLYFGQDNSIDNNVRNYIVVITSFLENPNKKLSDTIYEKSQILLLQLDNAVNFFQQESETKTKELQQRELLIFIGTILTILFEAHFFARPVIEMIKLKFQDFYEMLNNFIELRNNIDKTEPLKVKIITGELEQVIINIINNAKDAILEKKIKNPWIEIDLKQLNGFAILTIEDNGMGIPEDVLPKIFEVYFTTKSEDKGTGLGLHMSFKIITESLNGNIYAKNTQNGAMFTIELPIV